MFKTKKGFLRLLSLKVAVIYSKIINYLFSSSSICGSQMGLKVTKLLRICQKKIVNFDPATEY